VTEAGFGAGVSKRLPSRLRRFKGCFIPFGGQGNAPN